MKCNQCGTEFNGNFCPECGARIESTAHLTPPPIQQPTQQIYQPPMSALTMPMKKKPFFLRWGFIVIELIVIGAIFISINGNG